MGDKITDLFKEVRGEHIFVEIIYLISGLFLVIVVNLIFKPTDNFYPNWIYLNELQKTLFVLVVGYFIARICNEIGWAVKNLLSFIFRLRWYGDLRDLWKEFSSYVKDETKEIETDTEELGEADFDKFTASDTPFSYNSNRLIYMVIFESIFLGFVTVLSVFLSYKLLLLAFLLWLKLTFSEILHLRYVASVAKYHLKKGVENEVSKT